VGRQADHLDLSQSRGWGELVGTVEIEAFLYKEARLLDENRYSDWLTLWTQDATYWVPANKDDYDPELHVSIIYDRLERLKDRVDRLKSGAAWSQEPRSRTCRSISNIEILSPADTDDTFVRSNLVLGELRRGLQTTYFASQIHHLRAENGGLQMSFKKVTLINNDEPLHNLSFLI
jgi:3-phenylpropionate/cinnamic acid dioxygenase small subunit